MVIPAGIHRCCDRKAQWLPARSAGEHSSHRHTPGVSREREIATAAHLIRKIETAEEAYQGARATGSKGLAAFKSLEDRVARIFFCPYPSYAATVGFEPEQKSLIQ